MNVVACNHVIIIGECECSGMQPYLLELLVEIPNSETSICCMLVINLHISENYKLFAAY